MPIIILGIITVTLLFLLRRPIFWQMKTERTPLWEVLLITNQMAGVFGLGCAVKLIGDDLSMQDDLFTQVFAYTLISISTILVVVVWTLYLRERLSQRT